MSIIYNMLINDTSGRALSSISSSPTSNQLAKLLSKSAMFKLIDKGNSELTIPKPAPEENLVVSPQDTFTR